MTMQDSGNIHSKRGFAAVFFTILFAVIVLSFFGIDFRGMVDEYRIGYYVRIAWFIALEAWGSYVLPPLIYVWDKALNPYLVTPFLEFVS